MKRRISKETIFIVVNIAVILGILTSYLCRAIYYYKKTNYIPKSSDLYSIVVNLKNIASTGDGLYESDNTYYYRGNDVKNYLFYSDVMWRIVEINDSGIKLISDEDLTSMVYGIDSKYSDSYIYTWLNDGVFLKGLYNKDSTLSESDWCNTWIDVNNYNCSENIQSLVGLLTTEEYIRAGGKNSYLNNKSYWWTLNTSEKNNVYYVQTEGEIEDQNKTGSTYHSYGVRPVIILNRNVGYVGGDGSLENPYIIDNNMDVEINNHSIGTYISYKGYTFRIMEATEEYTKVILDGYLLNEDGEPVELGYYEISKYLENNFLNKLNLDDLVKFDFPVGAYDNTNNYNYQFSKTTDGYVGIPVIGDLHIIDYPSIWLNNSLTSDENLTYRTTDIGSVFAEFSTSKKYVRPVIAIKKGLLISEGAGTKSNPLVIGDSNEIETDN